MTYLVGCCNVVEKERERKTRWDIIFERKISLSISLHTSQPLLLHFIQFPILKAISHDVFSCLHIIHSLTSFLHTYFSIQWTNKFIFLFGFFFVAFWRENNTKRKWMPHTVYIYITMLLPLDQKSSQYNGCCSENVSCGLAKNSNS